MSRKTKPLHGQNVTCFFFTNQTTIQPLMTNLYNILYSATNKADYRNEWLKRVYNITSCSRLVDVREPRGKRGIAPCNFGLKNFKHYVISIETKNNKIKCTTGTPLVRVGNWFDARNSMCEIVNTYLLNSMGNNNHLQKYVSKQGIVEPVW